MKGMKRRLSPHQCILGHKDRLELKHRITPWQRWEIVLILNLLAIQKMIDELDLLQHCTEREKVLGALKAFVPEMRPWEGEVKGEPGGKLEPESRHVADGNG